MLNEKKKISVVSSCFNEAGNLQAFYNDIVNVMTQFPQYSYEIIMADNCSTDGSRDILRRIAACDKQFKVILNANNFGPDRSSFNALRQASGDAVVPMSSDLQDPPELIADFIKRWEAGYQVVMAVKAQSRENPFMWILRRFYYWTLSNLSDTDHIIQNFTGFGLYDRKFMNALKQYRDPVPYLRGFVSQIGFKQTMVEFVQPKRKHGNQSIVF